MIYKVVKKVGRVLNAQPDFLFLADRKYQFWTSALRRNIISSYYWAICVFLIVLGVVAKGKYLLFRLSSYGKVFKDLD